MMEYRIIETKDIFIIGLKAEANLKNISQVTPQLARQFMPRLNEINSRKDAYTVSLQNYENFDFKKFDPSVTFEKWIGVEVSHLEDVSERFNTLSISGGKYLVFDFKGSIEKFIEFWQFLHSNWLPNSEFELDDRPHFERLPLSYNPMKEVNEEEIWIPIK